MLSRFNIHKFVNTILETEYDLNMWMFKSELYTNNVEYIQYPVPIKTVSVSLGKNQSEMNT